MYTLAAAAAVIDPMNSVARVATFRTWLARGIIRYSETDQAPARAGVAGLLSRHRVIQLAIAAQLVDLGLPPKEAADVAVAFSDTAAPPRFPGILFPTGETTLCVWREASGEIRRRVLNHAATDGLDRIRQLLGGAKPLTEALIVIDCRAVLHGLEALIGSNSEGDVL
ncbi:hypothetical protein [Methylobacterium sp.]|uniref:hypothetical protein n=1 Tax=Methylobacterium sp. TaxID=409 RepID=UPI0025EEB576|nr:hypothetical protein [Methylobacterium sp.]MBY0256131.1 hypothetical protein [Methylobacterium sp.]